MTVRYDGQVVAYTDQLRRYDTGTAAPESGTGPIAFSTPVIAYSGQLKIH